MVCAGGNKSTKCMRESIELHAQNCGKYSLLSGEHWGLCAEQNVKHWHGHLCLEPLDGAKQSLDLDWAQQIPL